ELLLQRLHVARPVQITVNVRPEERQHALGVLLQQFLPRAFAIGRHRRASPATDEARRDVTSRRASSLSGAPVHARMPFPGPLSSTPVRRTSSPWNLNVSFLWSMPRQCRIVAFMSWMWTGFSTTL